jgi:hypothetical protein
MITQTVHSPKERRPASLIIFTIGVILLIGTWVILFGWLSLSTEALLVPWYSGLEPLPALGMWQRTINDFFAVFPGNILPSILFILVEITIFGFRYSRSENRTWLPAAFFLANVILLGADLMVTNLSWAISNWLVGPRVGIDAGFHRTWYGIVAHLTLWTVFFMALARTKMPGKGL